MTITESQAKAVGRSFTKIEKNVDRFAARFYTHLFEIGPDLRALFANVDMKTQGAMVVQAMRLVIGSLDTFDDVRPTIEGLGYRHANYGVEPDRYADAGEAFIRSLRDIHEDGLDPDTETAWRSVLGLVVSTLAIGARTVGERITTHRGNLDLLLCDYPNLDAYTARFLGLENQSPSEVYGAIDMADYPRSLTIEFAGDRRARGSPLQTVLDIAVGAEIPIACVCGGVARCSTCRVLVIEGLNNCLPRNKAETRIADAKGFPTEVRLACQTRVIGPVTLRRLVRDASDIGDAIAPRIERVGQEMRIAVMFIDIRGFTKFSETNLAYDVVHALNRYFDVVGKAIDAHHGYIDKYIGDSVMALFGVDTRRTIHPCVDAVNAAREALYGLAKVNDYLSGYLNDTFRIAAAIHYGNAIVGEIGFHERRQFTAIGDTANIAARLESEAKIRNATILISDAVWQELPPKMRAVGAEIQVQLRGKEDALIVHDLTPAMHQARETRNV